MSDELKIIWHGLPDAVALARMSPRDRAVLVTKMVAAVSDAIRRLIADPERKIPLSEIKQGFEEWLRDEKDEGRRDMIERVYFDIRRLVT
jgi:hypothetical protein